MFHTLLLALFFTFSVFSMEKQEHLKTITITKYQSLFHLSEIIKEEIIDNKNLGFFPVDVEKNDFGDGFFVFSQDKEILGFLGFQGNSAKNLNLGIAYIVKCYRGKNFLPIMLASVAQIYVNQKIITQDRIDHGMTVSWTAMSDGCLKVTNKLLGVALKEEPAQYNMQNFMFPLKMFL